MEAIMFFEQAIAHQIPGYTKEADHKRMYAMLSLFHCFVLNRCKNTTKF